MLWKRNTFFRRKIYGEWCSVLCSAEIAVIAQMIIKRIKFICLMRKLEKKLELSVCILKPTDICLVRVTLWNTNFILKYVIIFVPVHIIFICISKDIWTYVLNGKYKSYSRLVISRTDLKVIFLLKELRYITLIVCVGALKILAKLVLFPFNKKNIFTTQQHQWDLII